MPELVGNVLYIMI